MAEASCLREPLAPLPPKLLVSQFFVYGVNVPAQALQGVVGLDFPPGLFSQGFGISRVGKNRSNRLWARAAASPDRDDQAVFSWRTTSGRPPTSVTITGRPVAMASKRARDTPSLWLGRTKRSRA